MAFNNVDFGSRIAMLRAAGLALGVPSSSLPSINATADDISCLRWINKIREAQSVPRLSNLDYTGFMKAFNDLATLTSATSTWSASDAAANGMTLTNGGLTATSNPAGGNWTSIRNTISKTSGKLYVEFLCISPSSDGRLIWGMASAGFVPTGQLGVTTYSVGIYGGGTNYVSAGFTSNYAVSESPVAGSVIGLAVDFGAGGIWISLNNTWANSSNPATGSLPVISFTPATVGALFAAMSMYASNNGWTLQPAAASQTYLPPPGFQAWDGGPVTPVSSVWSASDAAANSMTLSNGGLTVTQTVGGFKSIRNTISKTSGKLYVEFLISVMPDTLDVYLGLASSGFNPVNYLGTSSFSGGVSYAANSVSSGFTSNYTVSQAFSPADVYALAVDFATGSVWVAKNNTWANSSNPATGSLPILSFVPATVGALFAAVTLYASTDSWTLKPTAASQTYAPPAGFSAWG